MTASTASPPVALLAAPLRTSARLRTTGLIMGVASALAFSSSGPFIKPLLEAGWSLGAALLVRMGVAGLVLSPALFLAMKRQRGFLRRHWRLIVGFGLMPVLGCQLFFFSAMQRMPVAVALLIQYLAPVMLVVFVWLRIARNRAGERISPATPMRTSSAAPSDQPASRRGLMNGPLEEKANADATAITSPVVRRRAEDVPAGVITGRGAVETVMAASDCQERTVLTLVTLPK